MKVKNFWKNFNDSDVFKDTIPGLCLPFKLALLTRKPVILLHISPTFLQIVTKPPFLQLFLEHSFKTRKDSLVHTITAHALNNNHCITNTEPILPNSKEKSYQTRGPITFHLLFPTRPERYNDRRLSIFRAQACPQVSNEGKTGRFSGGLSVFPFLLLLVTIIIHASIIYSGLLTDPYR